MPIDPGLAPGQVIDNNALANTFACSTQGGMRRSHKTNTLVLVSNHVESLYDDRWLGDIFHYTGMGRRGHQTLQGNQNRTLHESGTSGIDVHLFEVDRDNQYCYQGRVALAADAYQEVQPDEAGLDRNVWVFPLRLLDNVPVSIRQTDFGSAQERRTRKAAKLDLPELEKRANAAPGAAGQRQTTATSFERNPYVSRYAKERARGVCDLCGNSAPFLDRAGQPYLENHHIEWLARGGKDSIANTVALCPNCHRRMHLIDSPEDRQRLVLATKRALL